MANKTEFSRIVQKRSSVVGVVPTVPTGTTIDNTWLDTDLLIGEVFINVADDRYFVRTDNGIVEILMSGISSSNYYTTQAYLSGNTVVFDRNDLIAAYAVNLTTLPALSGISGTYLPLSGGSLTGGLSGTSLNLSSIGSGTSIINLGLDASGNVVTGTTGGGTGSGSFTNNGTNTYTGGTAAFQSVNISGGSFNNITISGSTVLNELSAATMSILNSGATSREYFDYSSNLVRTGVTNSAIVAGSGNTIAANISNVVILGGSYNTASQSSVVLAGSGNSISSAFASIMGGEGNSISSNGLRGFIGAGSSNSLTGARGFIGAGQTNSNTGSNGFVGAGTNNAVQTSFGVIVGGSGNYAKGASGFANVFAGTYNTASTANAAVITGSYNLADGINSLILAGTGHTVTGRNSVILAGADINATANDTAYVPSLNIKTVGSGTPNILLGLDTSGNVVTGSTSTPITFAFALSDETTAITSGATKLTYYLPHAMTLTSVRACLTTSGSTITTVDINEGGSTILSTKLTIDANEFSSTQALNQPVISDASLADDAKITFDIDGAGTGAAGLKVTLIGYKSL